MKVSQFVSEFDALAPLPVWAVFEPDVTGIFSDPVAGHEYLTYTEARTQAQTMNRDRDRCVFVWPGPMPLISNPQPAARPGALPLSA